ncbi:hypothetical protein HNQ77_004829 [Silvibacterium bohemicum]|uniref:Prolyl 4-hydroxylase alpha subunit Fe(2+) 2OG dioxygenase domain-containing protein n=1 Tax=Silvibacterium bohemicum TaxID=1577686 RepID=A0A841K8F1_9BACT|nr:hypothetical protein [Silvibacterium bohemicum]MBB6146848.1 hypothetical protein [Silvibacterium bohemicum]
MVYAMPLHKEFEYLGDKIEAASFRESPFTHLYIEDFLSDKHFDLVVNQKQINIPAQKTTKELIDVLSGCGWEIKPFPGCTTSIEEYLSCYEKNEYPVDKRRLEGFGLAYRLMRFDDSVISRLVEYLNSPHFKSALERKFRISRPNRIDTAIHKYLSGYEISPHPDMRSKCLTYLVNINTDRRSEDIPMHTHLLKFKDEKRFIYEFWKYNEQYDTDWVPWEWCETKAEIRKNNSLVMFAPSWNTLHAVKLRYDHLLFQRTQLYGNLWYTDVPFRLDSVLYDQFDFKPSKTREDGM